MLLRRVASTLLPLAACAATAAPAGAVVAGHDVAPADAPWLVGSPGCTGALIAPDRVLTAAHCVRGSRPGMPGWFLGTGTRAQGRPLTIVAIASHPGFDPEAPVSGDDVALLRLATPVTGVTPLRVATAGDAALTRPGAPVTTLGWGATQTAGTPAHPDFAGPSPIAQQGDLTVVSEAACEDFYRHAPADPTEIPKGLLCAGAPRTAACVGDSGGPLVARDATGAPVAVGVFSFTQRCGADGDPGAWTDLTSRAAFTAAESPTWAPAPQGRPTIVGRAKVGRTLRCVAPRWTGRVDRVRYKWERWEHERMRRPKSVTATHRVTRAEAGKKLECSVEASNAGGFVVSDGTISARVAR